MIDDAAITEGGMGTGGTVATGGSSAATGFGGTTGLGGQGTGGRLATGGTEATGGVTGLGGATGIGGAIGFGGTIGFGGQGMGGTRSLGGVGGSSTMRGTGGRVTVDASAYDAAMDSAPSCGSITVTALIDGRDKLHIVADGLFWEHLSHAGPGMHNYQTLATIITSSTGSTGSTENWCPVWGNDCNTCDGTCGELRDTGTSDLFPMKVFPATMVSVGFTCDGRNVCTLLQSPTPAKPEAIIDMDDIEPPGPSTYSVTLSFRCGPSG
jgi:hypothetical protein